MQQPFKTVMRESSDQGIEAAWSNCDGGLEGLAWSPLMRGGRDADSLPGA